MPVPLLPRLLRLLPALALGLCLAGPTPADAGAGCCDGEIGDGAAAIETARDARKAAKKAMSTLDHVAAPGRSPAAIELTSPGQGMTATADSASAGVSSADRAALDALRVNRDAWAPF